MKILKIFIILFLSISFSQLKADEINNELKNKILKNIRCLICQGQSVYDSESDFASSIKIIVDKKINEGSSEDQIYHFLKEKYGEWIVYNPKLKTKRIYLFLKQKILIRKFILIQKKFLKKILFIL